MPRRVSATLGRMTERKGISGKLFSVRPDGPGGKRRQGLMRTRFWIYSDVPRCGLPGCARQAAGLRREFEASLLRNS